MFPALVGTFERDELDGFVLGVVVAVGALKPELGVKGSRCVLLPAAGGKLPLNNANGFAIAE